MNLKNAALAALLAFGLTSAASAQTITVINGTGGVVQQLGLAAAGTSEFEDLLGDDVLNADEGLQIELSGDSNGWDMLANDPAGNQVEWSGLNLTGVSKIVLRSDGTAELE